MLLLLCSLLALLLLVGLESELTWMLLLLCSLLALILFVGLESKFTVHRFIAGSRPPLRTTAPWQSVMVTQCRLNLALQPASQSLGTDRRGAFMVGNKCAVRASGGKSGSSNVPVWVDFMVDLSGRPTKIPKGFLVKLETGVPIGRKWSVQPVSNMALIVAAAYAASWTRLENL